MQGCQGRGEGAGFGAFDRRDVLLLGKFDRSRVTRCLLDRAATRNLITIDFEHFVKTVRVIANLVHPHVGSVDAGGDDLALNHDNDAAAGPAIDDACGDEVRGIAVKGFFQRGGDDRIIEERELDARGVQIELGGRGLVQGRVGRGQHRRIDADEAGTAGAWLDGRAVAGGQIRGVEKVWSAEPLRSSVNGRGDGKAEHDPKGAQPRGALAQGDTKRFRAARRHAARESIYCQTGLHMIRLCCLCQAERFLPARIPSKPLLSSDDGALTGAAGDRGANAVVRGTLIGGSRDHLTKNLVSRSRHAWRRTRTELAGN